MYGCRWQRITIFVFQPASMMVKRGPRHGKHMALLLMYKGVAVPKDVSTADVSSKLTARDADHARDLLRAHQARGDPDRESA